MKKQTMKNFTVVVYQDTFDRYIKLKEKQNWTHDEALTELVTHYLKTPNKRSERF